MCVLPPVGARTSLRASLLLNKGNTGADGMFPGFACPYFWEDFGQHTACPPFPSSLPENVRGDGLWLWLILATYRLFNRFGCVNREELEPAEAMIPFVAESAVRNVERHTFRQPEPKVVCRKLYGTIADDEMLQLEINFSNWSHQIGFDAHNVIAASGNPCPALEPDLVGRSIHSEPGERLL